MKKQQLLGILTEKLNKYVELRRSIVTSNWRSNDLSVTDKNIETISMAFAVLNDFVFKPEATVEELIEYLIGDI